MRIKFDEQHRTCSFRVIVDNESRINDIRYESLIKFIVKVSYQFKFKYEY